MATRLCVTIRETRTQRAVAAMQQAARWSDMVEIRGDYLEDLHLGRLLADKPCPVLFTIRSRNDGGIYSGLETDRLNALAGAYTHGADYVDIEFGSRWQEVMQRVPRENVVLSWHDVSGMPADMEQRLEAMAATGAGVLKIAVRARSLSDNLPVAKLLARARARGWNLIALAMGPAGIPSRIFGSCWGSWLTFASPPGVYPPDGQLPVDELTGRYRIRHINPDTACYGVVGGVLEHSLSPAVHNAAFAALGRDAVYVPLPAADMDDLLGLDALLEFRGLSVTLPYKEVAQAWASRISSVAERIGAVNTLIRREHEWYGENTDVEGFLRPLPAEINRPGIRAVVLGSGGAARAVVFALRSRGAAVCIVGRNQERARSLAKSLDAESAPWEEIARLRFDLLVNATPVGMYPKVDESPVPPECLRGQWVYDLVYNPRMTRLLRDACGKGCRVVTGGAMFLSQAILQQMLWFGRPAPEAAMKEALDRCQPGDDIGLTHG